MAFHDVSLPDGLQYGSAAGASFATIAVPTASGHEYRVARQAQGRHRFTLRKELQSTAEAAALKAFALGRRGALHSFRLKDFSDYTSNTDGVTAPTTLDQIIGTGDGTTQTFQLLKAYDPAGADPYQRTIHLPVSGTVVCALNTTTTTAFTVNGQGEVTFSSAPGVGVTITAGFEFDVPARFTAEVDQWAQLQADAYEVWSLPQLACIEVLSEVEHPDRWYAGGSLEHDNVTQDITLSLNDGMLQIVEANAAINVWLPPVSRIPTGPHVFFLTVSLGASGSVQLKDEDGNNVGTTISPGSTVQIGLVEEGASARWWVY